MYLRKLKSGIFRHRCQPWRARIRGNTDPAKAFARAYLYYPAFESREISNYLRLLRIVPHLIRLLG
jgi:hypothetical protein